MSNRFLLALEDEKHRTELTEALRICSITSESITLDSLARRERVDGAQAVLVELATNGSARIDVLRALREHSPDLPVLCGAADADAQRLDELYQLRVDVCGRPLSVQSVLRFVERTRSLPPVGDAALAERVRRAASATGLSRRETELLALATQGLPRRAIAEALSVSENTVKAQVRSLLKKTGARSLAVLGQQVLRGMSASS